MMSLAAFALALAGMACLSLSMHRHARQTGFGGSIASRRMPLRAIGWLLLGAALLATHIGLEWRYALIEWTGLLAAGAGVVVLALTYRPRALPALAFAALAIGLAALLILPVMPA